MATEPQFLKIINGDVILYNSAQQPIKRFYTRGDAVRADWFERDKGSIEVLTKNGRTLVINSACQVIRQF